MHNIYANNLISVKVGAEYSGRKLINRGVLQGCSCVTIRGYLKLNTMLSAEDQVTLTDSDDEL
jgi:hypothetical protein